MLFHLLIVAVLSCLVTADVTCPDGKLSCPTGKTCCFTSGSFSCCDLLDDDKIVPGSPSLGFPNTSDSMNVQSTTQPWDYCPYTFGKKICCDKYQQNCVAGSDCCTNSKCCYSGSRCCGNGQWCCSKPLKCGVYYMSCYSSALAFTPAIGTLAAMAMACIASKLYLM